MRNIVAFMLFISVGLGLFIAAVLTGPGLVSSLRLAVLAVIFIAGLALHLKDFFTREINEELHETNREKVLLVCVAVVATSVTHYLNIYMGLGPVVASGIVGVVASLLLPSPFAVMAYTGAFVGMSSRSRFPSWYYVMVAGLMVGTLYIVTRRVYQGFGGRLGTVAAVAVLLTLALFRIS